ncbi:MAG: FAD-dependent thymidylate synthase [Chloroflexi bacterium]|nr:FAD-dependent thymidylate synthase [Chloroflexota bacterium]
MDVQLIGVTHVVGGQGGPQELLEHAGRVCYRSAARGKAERFLRSRIAEGHESIIEHASLTFEISGISRACSHQLVRHRLASYSQESQRYVEMSDAQWVVPPRVAADSAAMVIWEAAIADVQRAYRDLRDLGIPREDARYLLPNATQTRLVVTMNFRELRHVFRLRISRQAQWEIRDLALAMLRLAYDVAPGVFSDIWEDLNAQYPEWFA